MGDICNTRSSARATSFLSRPLLSVYILYDAPHREAVVLSQRSLRCLRDTCLGTREAQGSGAWTGTAVLVFTVKPGHESE